MFQLPEEVKKDIKRYEKSLADLQGGKISAERFKGIRVPWGIYSHRGGKVHMSRIRIPAGEIFPEQLKALAFVAKKYGSDFLHLTTRQDIQIHELKIEDTLPLMEYLREYNLSPRGGGGNSVRNVTACALAGVCAKEVFDVRGTAIGVTEYLLQQESSFNLPRKFKVTFSGCLEDCSGCAVNDVGLIARISNGKRGFKVFVGGGLGASPKIGKLLDEFVPEAEIVYLVQAVRNVFSQKGDRKNKHRNRLRFLIEELGFAEFVSLYQKELANLKKEGEIELREVKSKNYKTSEEKIPEEGTDEYKAFLTYNVTLQKQQGYSAVALRIPRGDISAEQLEQLADLERSFSGIDFRSSPNQNLYICGVKNQDLAKLFQKLKTILSDFLYPETLLDVVACKGALTCNLGLCNSPALAESIEAVIKKQFIGKRVFKKFDLKLNGCPNACGHHPVGKLALHGMVKKIDNRPVPFYKIFVGGRRAAEKTRLANEVGVIPARNILDFLVEFLNKLENEVNANEIALELIPKYSRVPGYKEDRDFYIDWGRSEEFSLAGVGPGECGVGVLDMIESDLKDAKKSFAAGDLYKALVFASRALLITRGIEPLTDRESFEKFETYFVETGIIAYRFKNLAEVAKNPINEKNYVEEFLEEIATAYKEMDSNFKFPLREEIKQETEKKKVSEEKVTAEEVLMDLRGVACPINYVKAKMRLETMEKGTKLLLYLDAGEPIKNVPSSLTNDGQDVMRIEEKKGFFEVLVKKEV